MHDVAAHICVWGLMSNPSWTEAAGEPLKPSLRGVGEYWSTDQAKYTANANLMPAKAQASESPWFHLGFVPIQGFYTSTSQWNNMIIG